MTSRPEPSRIIRVDPEIYEYIHDARIRLESQRAANFISMNTALRFLLSLDKLAWIK